MMIQEFLKVCFSSSSSFSCIKKGGKFQGMGRDASLHSFAFLDKEMVHILSRHPKEWRESHPSLRTKKIDFGGRREGVPPPFQ